MRRMMARATADEDESAIDITPMLDVVFIMLIFFIVTTSFVKEPGISPQRPTAETATQKTRGNRPEAATAVMQVKANILIAIDADNEIWIDRRRIDVRAVRPNIERLHAENPQGSVVIQADKESKTETLISVMDASRSAGVFNVAIAAEAQ